MGVRSFAAALFCAASMLWTACGGSDDPSDDAGSTALAKAMGSVADSAPARASFAWSDSARIRELAGYPDSALAFSFSADDPYSTIFGIGAPDLFPSNRVLAERFGIDVFAADSALTVGVPPAIVIRLDGEFDSGTVKAALERAGGRAQGDTVSFGDGSIDLDNPLTSLGLVGITEVSATDETIAIARGDASVDDVTDDSDPLSENPGFAAMSTCLGDVLDALIIDSEANTPQDRLVGIGTLPPEDETFKEVACVLADDAGTAKTQAGLAEERMAPDALDITTANRMGDYVKNVKVETGVGDEAMFRVTATLQPGNQPGFFYEALQRAVIFDYLGTQTMPPPQAGG